MILIVTLGGNRAARVFTASGSNKVQRTDSSAAVEVARNRRRGDTGVIGLFFMNTGFTVYDGNMLGNNIYDRFLFILSVRNKECSGRRLPAAVRK